MPKKILIVTECYYPEEFKINDVALAWKDKGYDIDVLTLVPTYPLGRIYKGYKNKFYSIEILNGVKIIRIRAVEGYRESRFKKILKYLNFMFISSCFAVFNGRKYDYVFGYNMSALTDMVPAVLIHKLYNKKLMLWVQDLWPDSVYAYGYNKSKLLNHLLVTFVRIMYSSTNNISISSRGFETQLKPYIKKGTKFSFAPNWADELDTSLEPVILSQEKKVHFTFAGNVGMVQNLDNIVNAFSLLSDEYQFKSQLNIVGDGSNLDNLKLLSKNIPSIVFHGLQKREDMYSYYSASDYLIVSLIDEPIFSNLIPAKTQTYIAAKKPILAIINGEVEQLVKKYNLGLHANPSCIQDIKDVFCECIEMDKSSLKDFNRSSEYLLNYTFNRDIVIDSLLENLTNDYVAKSCYVIGTSASTLLNFRGNLLAKLIGRNYNVTCISPSDSNDIVQKLIDIGASHESIKLKRNRISVINDFSTLIKFTRSFSKNKPNFVLAYGIKMIVWGGLASAITGTRFIALFTGLGFSFYGKSLKRNILRNIVIFLCRFSLKRSEAVIFQNNDNRNLFINIGLVKKDHSYIVNGSGVDINKFKFTKLPSSEIVFLCVGRLLGEKGIREYAGAAKIVKEKFPNASFNLVGPEDSSRDAIPLMEVNSWSGYVNYKGQTKDIRPYIENCHVFVLPSHHEGLPRSTIEAMSIGRPVITTDAVGCKDTVEEGVNGFKVNVNSIDSLVDRMIWFIKNKEDIEGMGLMSHTIVKDKFDVEKINSKMLKIIDI